MPWTWLLSIFSGRSLLVAVGVVGAALLVGGPMLEARSLRAELGRVNAKEAAATALAAENGRRATAAVAGLEEMQRAVNDYLARQRRADDVVAAATKREQLLRAEVGQLQQQLAKRQTARQSTPKDADCKCDALRDAIDVLRDQQSRTRDTTRAP